MKKIKKAIIIIILMAGVGTATFFIGRQIGLNTDTSSTSTTIEEVTYLVAPYDCVITEINIPESGEKCTNEHYVKVASNNTLSVQFKVDETKVSSISLGQSASVSFSAFEDKSLEAVVTNVSNTASNGKFTVTVEFDNDGDVMLGMTAEVCLEV